MYTPPIIERLSKYLDGVNLTSSDIVAMQDLCAYEVSLARPYSANLVSTKSSQSVALGYSSFCDLFTQSDWEAYEYWYGKCLRAFRVDEMLNRY